MITTSPTAAVATVVESDDVRSIRSWSTLSSRRSSIECIDEIGIQSVGEEDEDEQEDNKVPYTTVFLTGPNDIQEVEAAVAPPSPREWSLDAEIDRAFAAIVE